MTAAASAAPSPGSVPPPGSSKSTIESRSAAESTACTRLRWPLKVLSPPSSDCASPRSARTRRAHGSAGRSELARKSPARAISAASPSVLSAAVLPPVLGPVMTTVLFPRGTKMSIGTTAGARSDASSSASGSASGSGSARAASFAASATSRSFSAFSTASAALEVAPTLKVGRGSFGSSCARSSGCRIERSSTVYSSEPVLVARNEGSCPPSHRAYAARMAARSSRVIPSSARSI
mmetsp:Transcript_20470/g.66473  ORF Transcript_20470/g.66473 Transcript_20470/m.66473 type:complete len:236 (+) Transcript_20470:1066-1773(+)